MLPGTRELSLEDLLPLLAKKKKVGFCFCLRALSGFSIDSRSFGPFVVAASHGTVHFSCLVAVRILQEETQMLAKEYNFFYHTGTVSSCCCSCCCFCRDGSVCRFARLQDICMCVLFPDPQLCAFCLAVARVSQSLY